MFLDDLAPFTNEEGRLLCKGLRQISERRAKKKLKKELKMPGILYNKDGTKNEMMYKMTPEDQFEYNCRHVKHGDVIVCPNELNKEQAELIMERVEKETMKCDTPIFGKDIIPILTNSRGRKIIGC